MWSCVGKEAEPQWFWHAIDHHSETVLAHVFGGRKEMVLLRLQALPEPFGLRRASTAHKDSLVMGMAGEELPAKATSPALQVLPMLNALTSPVHSPALPAALGSGSTRATGVSPS